MLKFADRKKTIGPKVFLKTIEGEWVRPKMLNVAQQDELKILQQRALKSAGVGASKVIEIERVKAKLKEDENSEGEIPESVYDTVMALNAMPSAELARFLLKNGIGGHSFVDDTEEGSSEVSDTMVEELMEYSDISLEIVKIVSEFNSPLAPTTSGTSETSQSGSTGEVSLKTETPSQTSESLQT